MPEGEIRFQKAETIYQPGEPPLVYVNSVEVKITPYDIQFNFGQSTDVTPDGKVLVTKLIDLAMSPQHAKAFAAVLAQHILAYERLIGPIALPEASELPTASAQPAARSRGGARGKASRP